MTASVIPMHGSGADGSSVLRAGERLSQPEFHRRYLLTPDGVKAELVEGIVYMASPVGRRHGRSHGVLATVFGVYEASTPGVEMADNATMILGPESEPQPDLQMRLLPGRGAPAPDEGDVLTGPAELVAEVSHSTETLDLNAKRRDYDRAGAVEYLVLLIARGTLRAFGPGGAELPVGDDGVFRSKAFPGLWIDAAAVAEGDTGRALRVLKKGLRSREHAGFLKRLKAVAPAGSVAPKRTRRKRPAGRGKQKGG